MSSLSGHSSSGSFFLAHACALVSMMPVCLVESMLKEQPTHSDEQREMQSFMGAADSQEGRHAAAAKRNKVRAARSVG